MLPITDLSREYGQIAEEIESAVVTVLRSSNYILGPVVKDFEQKLAEYCECKYAIGVASGTDALLLALLALGIGPGDEVITSPFTFVATASAICRTGATPVFVDIDERTFNIDVSKIEEAITSRTKAILPVHLFGQPADMESILVIARKFDLYVIEDAAQAIGASFKGKRVGALGDVAAISFYPTKNLGAFGDGGAVVTSRNTVAEQVDHLRRHGARVKHYHEQIGFNSRLDELQAAVLRVKLKYLDKWNEQRREVASRYNDMLANSLIRTPYELRTVYSVYHQYTIQVPDQREELQGFLRDHGFLTAVYYPYGLHVQPAFKSLGYSRGQFPVAESVCRRVLSLPCFPRLTYQEQKAVADLVREFYDAKDSKEKTE